MTERAYAQDKAADPYSIEGTITRCFGVSEDIARVIKQLGERTQRFRIMRIEVPLGDKVPMELPEARSELAVRLENLYGELCSHRFLLEDLDASISE